MYNKYPGEGFTYEIINVYTNKNINLSLTFFSFFFYIKTNSNS